MIVVTRPDPAGTQLSELLTAAGHSNLHLPGLCLQPLSPSAENKRQAWAADWWVFLSPAAIDTATWLKTGHAPNRSWPKIAVLSSVSATRLGEALGIIPPLPEIIWPDSGYRSEHLLSHPELQQVATQQVAIFTARGGRTLLRDTLIQRGAQVQEMLVYARQPAELDAANLLQLGTWAGKLLTLWTSTAAINNLRQQLNASLWSKIQAGNHLLLSDRQKNALAAAGTGKMFLAEAPDNQSLQQQLSRLYQQG